MRTGMSGLDKRSREEKKRETKGQYQGRFKLCKHYHTVLEVKEGG